MERDHSTELLADAIEELADSVLVAEEADEDNDGVGVANVGTLLECAGTCWGDGWCAGAVYRLCTAPVGEWPRLEFWVNHQVDLH